MPRASANRAPDDRRSDERTRLLFAKNDDDVGLLRAIRERQDQKNCGEVTIGHPNIRAVPVRPFRRDQE